MRKIILRVSGYLHSILVLMAVLTPVYGAGLLAEKQVMYGIYWLGAWIAVPVIVSGIAIQKCRSVALYLLLGILSLAGMLAPVGIMGKYFLTDEIRYFLLAVLLAEALTVQMDHLRVRIALTRAKKDGSVYDTSWVPPASIFEKPSGGGFLVFGIIYLLGILISSRVICNVALVEGILYFFLYLLYRFVSMTEGYFRLHHNIKNIPTKRVYGITGGVLGILAVFLVGVAALSVAAAPQRKYLDIPNMGFGDADFAMEDMMGGPPPQMGGFEELLGEEYAEAEPMPRWVEMLFEGLAAALVIALCGLAVWGIWRYLRVFRERPEENGDLVEDLAEIDQKEEALPSSREREPRTERERIRRLYRKTIRKYRKEAPKASETPLEIERMAGIDQKEEIQELHVKYEGARYGKDCL